MMRSDYQLIELPGYDPSMREVRILLPEILKNRHAEMQTELQTELHHTLWKELHTSVRTQEQFANWVARVPNFGCGCQSWLKDYLVANPPRYADWPRWTWELHSSVSRKLNKTEFSWEQFCEKYPKEDF